MCAVCGGRVLPRRVGASRRLHRAWRLVVSTSELRGCWCELRRELLLRWWDGAPNQLQRVSWHLLPFGMRHERGRVSCGLVLYRRHGAAACVHRGAEQLLSAIVNAGRGVFMPRGQLLRRRLGSRLPVHVRRRERVHSGRHRLHVVQRGVLLHRWRGAAPRVRVRRGCLVCRRRKRYRRHPVRCGDILHRRLVAARRMHGGPRCLLRRGMRR